MAYAHAVIEITERDEESGQSSVVARYERNDEVPTDVPGYDELVEAGSVGDDQLPEEAFKPQPPDEIEIEGVVYVRAGETANSKETAKNA